MSDRTEEPFSEYLSTLDCVHCGLCIPHCPTHDVTGREADSPRGRIHLLRAWAEGRTELGAAAHEHLDRCIVCRACESVCPSGVRMGDLMETFRAERDAEFRSGASESRLARFAFRSLLPHRDRLRTVASAMAFYERSGLARVTGALLGRLAPRTGRAHAMRPIPPPREERRLPTDDERPEGFAARGERRGRVALFLGCLTDEWFADVHRATIRVLTANGFDVSVPAAQTCCGALQRHAGLLDDAAQLQTRNDRTFRDAGFDAVIVNSAGCGASLKEPLREDGSPPPYRDVLEFLAERGLRPPTLRVERRVTYDPPCHLLHGQGRDDAEELLAAVPGLELRPLRRRERCCGAGGVYNLLQPEMADAVLADKVENVLATGADVVVTGNPGCVLQLRYGLRRSDLQVLHPVQILDLAYEAGRS